MLTATFQDIPIPTKHQPEKCTMGRFPRVGMAPECRLRESLLIWRYWRSPWFFRGVGKNHQPVIKMPPAWPFQQDGIWRQTATERTMMLCIHRKAKLVGLVGREQGRMSFRIVHFFGLTWVDHQRFWWILQKWNLDYADILFWSLSSPGPVTLGDVRKSLNLLPA